MIKVSYFSSVNDIIPKDYSLEEWLQMTIEPPKNLEESVNKYRETFEKKYKEKLPCITISASFKGKRNLNNIKAKTGLLCLDIDRFSKGRKKRSNDCVDMNLVKEKFMTHPSCIYTGFSCGGDGVYAIFKVDVELELIEFFEYFKERLSKIGLNIDESCKDYTRLRFFSVVREGYFNTKAKTLFFKKNQPNDTPVDNEPEKVKEKEVKNPETKERMIERLSNWDKTKIIIQTIEAQRIDITSSYDDWVKVGAALQIEFGEDGRDAFHRISSIHPEYKKDECDKKYDKCKGMNKIKFSSLFYIASSYGIRY